MQLNYKGIMILFVIIACGVGGYFAYDYWDNRVPKLNSFDGISLGMSEVDVTVLYGRRPDCPSNEGSASKELNYYDSPGSRHWRSSSLLKSPCRIFITLTKTAEGEAHVTSICSNSEPSELFSSTFRKGDLIERLGAPSYRSISTDGTLVYSNYPEHNLALMTEGRYIREWCVSDYLPIKFQEEYKG